MRKCRRLTSLNLFHNRESAQRLDELFKKWVRALSAEDGRKAVQQSLKHQSVIPTNRKREEKTDIESTGLIQATHKQLSKQPFEKRNVVVKMIQKMQLNDVIEPSTRPLYSPVVLFKKKDGSTQFCVDCRKLNVQLEKTFSAAWY